MTIWRSNSMFCVLPLKCIDFSPPPLLLKSTLSKALVTRNIGCLVLRNSPAFSLQFCPKIHLVCDRKFRTTSFQTQALKKTNDREGIYEHTFELSLNCFHIFHYFLSNPIQCRWTLTWRLSSVWSSLVYTVILSSSVESVWGFPLKWVLGKSSTRIP